MSLAVFINVQNRVAVFILQRLVEPEGAFIQRHIAQIRIHASQSKNVIGQRIRQPERAGCRIQLRACLVDVDGVGDSRLLVAALDAVALLDVHRLDRLFLVGQLGLLLLVIERRVVFHVQLVVQHAQLQLAVHRILQEIVGNLAVNLDGHIRLAVEDRFRTAGILIRLHGDVDSLLLLCAFAHRRQISLDGNALLAPLVADLIAIRNRTGIVQLLIDNGHLRAVRFAKNQPRAAVFDVLHHNVRRERFGQGDFVVRHAIIAQEDGPVQLVFVDGLPVQIANAMVAELLLHQVVRGGLVPRVSVFARVNSRVLEVNPARAGLFQIDGRLIRERNACRRVHIRIGVVQHNAFARRFKPETIVVAFRQRRFRRHHHRAFIFALTVAGQQRNGVRHILRIMLFHNIEVFDGVEQCLRLSRRHVVLHDFYSVFPFHLLVKRIAEVQLILNILRRREGVCRVPRYRIQTIGVFAVLRRIRRHTRVNRLHHIVTLVLPYMRGACLLFAIEFRRVCNLLILRGCFHRRFVLDYDLSGGVLEFQLRFAIRAGFHGEVIRVVFSGDRCVIRRDLRHIALAVRLRKQQTAVFVHKLVEHRVRQRLVLDVETVFVDGERPLNATLIAVVPAALLQLFNLNVSRVAVRGTLGMIPLSATLRSESICQLIVFTGHSVLVERVFILDFVCFICRKRRQHIVRRHGIDLAAFVRRVRINVVNVRSRRTAGACTVRLDFCRSRVNSGHLTPVRVCFNLRDGHVCQGHLLIHSRHDVSSSRVLAVRALCGFDFDGILNRSFFPVDISPAFPSSQIAEEGVVAPVDVLPLHGSRCATELDGQVVVAQILNIVLADFSAHLHGAGAVVMAGVVPDKVHILVGEPHFNLFRCGIILELKRRLFIAEFGVRARPDRSAVRFDMRILCRNNNLVAFAMAKNSFIRNLEVRCEAIVVRIGIFRKYDVRYRNIGNLHAALADGRRFVRHHQEARVESKRRHHHVVRLRSISVHRRNHRKRRCRGRLVHRGSSFGGVFRRRGRYRRRKRRFFRRRWRCCGRFRGR